MDKSAKHLISPKSVQYVAWRRFFKTGRLLRATSMSMTLLMLVCRFFKTGRLLRTTSMSMALLMLVCRFFRNTASVGFCTYSTYFTRSTYCTYSTRLHIGRLVLTAH